MSSKDKILDTAQDLFYRNGYLSTSVDDIIGNAGVSKSNFYYHFKTKEDLGLFVLDQRKEDLRRMLELTLDNHSLGPKERLQNYLDMTLDAQAARLNKGGCPLGNLVAEMAEHSERFRCRLSSMFENLHLQITELIMEGQNSGQFRKDVEASALAHLIVQTVQGMHLMTKCYKSVDNFGKTAPLLLKLISS
jgi:TetR/AcrR family transcriptional repressor of nem operon